MTAMLFQIVLLATSVLGSPCARCTGPNLEVDPGTPSGAPEAESDALGNVHVRTDRTSGVCRDFLHVRSVDSAISWGPLVGIDGDPVYDSCNVDRDEPIGVDGTGRVYAPFLARAGGTGPETLVIKVSTDNGTSWPPAVTVIATMDGGTAVHSLTMHASPGGRAWVFWLDGPAQDQVRVRMSMTEDAGRTWSPPVEVLGAGSQGVIAHLELLDEGQSFLAVARVSESPSRQRIQFSRSDDLGRSWTSPVLVDDLAVDSKIFLGRILSWADGQVLVTWADDRAGNREAWSRVSLDGGRTWDLPVQRVDAGDVAGTAPTGEPDIVRSGPGKEVAAVFTDWRDGFWRLYGNFSPDGGLSWGIPAGAPAYPISTFAPDGRIFTFSLSGHGEWINLAWVDHSRDWMARCPLPDCRGVWSTLSCDGGRTWEPDRMLIDKGVSSVRLVPLPFAADAMVLLWSAAGQPSAVRLDGPTVATTTGISPYCLGADPTLDAQAVSAGCPGGLSLQWYVDDVAQPGQFGTSFTPALPPGDHVVDVRGTCFTDPTCAPGWIGKALRVVAPATPADVGNNLRAVRAGPGLTLDWQAAPPSTDAHAHVRRSSARGQPGTLISPDPGQTARTFDDAPPGPGALWLYDVRQADPCERESAN